MKKRFKSKEEADRYLAALKADVAKIKRRHDTNPLPNKYAATSMGKLLQYIEFLEWERAQVTAPKEVVVHGRQMDKTVELEPGRIVIDGEFEEVDK